MAASSKTDALSFLDQCTFICLKFIARYGSFEEQYKNSATANELCTMVTQEAREFGEDAELLPLCEVACCMADISKQVQYDDEKLAECLHSLHDFLDNDLFDECADYFVGTPIDSMEKFALLLILIYETCDDHELSTIGRVIDVGVRYMRKTLRALIRKQGGWRALAMKLSSHQGQEDISASIVVVSDEDVQRELGSGDHASEESGDADYSATQTYLPLDTPPFSIPSSVNTTDDDRDSLATPPELVERPLMTDSYMDVMGVDQLRRLSSQNGEGFEIVGSSENPVKDTVRKIEQEIPSVNIREDYDKITSTDIPKEPDQNAAILGGYLPHVSVGVAAAAAIAGFFVLRKNL